jgi:hypothetical protein
MKNLAFLDLYSCSLRVVFFSSKVFAFFWPEVLLIIFSTELGKISLFHEECRTKLGYIYDMKQSNIISEIQKF